MRRGTKEYIFGTLFLKRLSDRFDQEREDALGGTVEWVARHGHLPVTRHLVRCVHDQGAGGSRVSPQFAVTVW